jgi:hypothetical protein
MLGRALYGEKRELITFQCAVCKVPTPMWVDREDYERAKLGVPVQLAFANRTGQAYLSSPELQFLINSSWIDASKAQNRLML